MTDVSIATTRAEERTIEPILAIDAEVALMRRDALWIDLRSPSEYAADHMVGAVNVPLFDDVQRALVGTLYSKQSPEAAFAAGRELVRERVLSLLDEVTRACGWQTPAADLGALVDELTSGGLRAMESRLRTTRAEDLPGRLVVLTCQRGGLRSRSVAALLRALGMHSVVVEGGYKACRRAIVARLERWRAPRSFVLRGLTGVGKSLVLRALEELRPNWTIDLEALAHHRSSILGGVGLAPATQKRFESDLSECLARVDGACVVLEGESRKVGDVILPTRIWRALEQGESLELETDLERRVDVLIEDYLRCAAHRVEFADRLGFIEQRLGEREWDTELVRMLETGRERDLAKLLLERYYDPRYRHAEQGRVHAARFDSTDPRACARAIVAWIETRTAATAG